MAFGYVMPQRRSRDWFVMALLDQALHGGRAGRVYREMVLEKQIAVEADRGGDDIFGYDGPSQMTTRIFHKPQISGEDTLAALDQIVRLLQEKRVSDSELDQLKVTC